MKFEEKMELLRQKHFALWLKTRQEMFDKLSDEQSMFCVCGRLATGLHEMNCRKFNKRVDQETVKKLCKDLNIS